MNSFGSNIKITLFGGSHEPELGCIIEGLPAGKKIDLGKVFSAIKRRSAAKGGMGATARLEADIPRITSGFDAASSDDNTIVTDGLPLTASFVNAGQRRGDYNRIARPSHADFVSRRKYGESRDISGGGQSSGRMTLPLVFAGAVCAQLIGEFGIACVSHVLRIGSVCDDRFDPMSPRLDENSGEYFPLVNASQKAEMERQIASAAADGDTLSCECECAVTGLPVGVGEPFFNGVESMLSHLLFSIPGVRGVEFGEREHIMGSQMNDQFADGGRTQTNRSGGVNGGITNGMPLVFRCWFRPVPSIGLPQTGYDMRLDEPVPLTVTGRHDVCILPRGCAAVEAAANICICDLIRGYLC